MNAIPLVIQSVVAPDCTNKVVDLVADADEIFLKAYLSSGRLDFGQHQPVGFDDDYCHGMKGYASAERFRTSTTTVLALHIFARHIG